MVIFDTETYKNQGVKGLLVINLYDVDYLVKKYGQDALRETIANDYVDYFVSELDKRKKEDLLSIQYYVALQLGIENEKDEKILELIKKEVDDNNIFAKRSLTKIPYEDLQGLIDSLLIHKDELTDEELCKLRAYKMAKFCQDEIKRGNEIVADGYEYCNFDYTEYKNISNNLSYMGLSSNIVESDYFKPFDKKDSRDM